MARYDLLRSIAYLASCVTKWTDQNDRDLYRLICYINTTKGMSMEGVVGDDLNNLELRLFSLYSSWSYEVYSMLYRLGAVVYSVLYSLGATKIYSVLYSSWSNDYSDSTRLGARTIRVLLVLELADLFSALPSWSSRSIHCSTRLCYCFCTGLAFTVKTAAVACCCC